MQGPRLRTPSEGCGHPWSAELESRVVNREPPVLREYHDLERGIDNLHTTQNLPAQPQPRSRGPSRQENKQGTIISTSVGGRSARYLLVLIHDTACRTGQGAGGGLVLSLLQEEEAVRQNTAALPKLPFSARPLQLSG
jgi:hypothetical protein